MTGGLKPIRKVKKTLNWPSMAGIIAATIAAGIAAGIAADIAATVGIITAGIIAGMAGSISSIGTDRVVQDWFCATQPVIEEPADGLHLRAFLCPNGGASSPVCSLSCA